MIASDLQWHWGLETRMRKIDLVVVVVYFHMVKILFLNVSRKNENCWVVICRLVYFVLGNICFTNQHNNTWWQELLKLYDTEFVPITVSSAFPWDKTTFTLPEFCCSFDNAVYKTVCIHLGLLKKYWMRREGIYPILKMYNQQIKRTSCK